MFEFIIIYVILGIISYFLFKKLLDTSSPFEKIWYSIFWPATWIVIGIGAFKDKYIK
jgi:hypothetical protein